jgi:RHS repeat-associated protein
MARTAPVPNFAAIPGMNPGLFVLGGGGDGGGSGAGGGKGGAGKQGAGGKNGGNDASGGGKNGLDPSRYPMCGTASHPVDVVTGRAFTHPIVDFELAGPIPLSWQRVCSSTMADGDAGLGWGWGHSFGWWIEVRRRRIIVWSEQGVSAEFPMIEPGDRALGPFGWLLRREGEAVFSLDVDDGVLRRFAAPGQAQSAGGPASPAAAEPDAEPGVLRLCALEDRNGNRITLSYEGGRLARIDDSAGRVLRIAATSAGRIAAIRVQNAPSQGRWIDLVRYLYDDEGHLVEAIDADGFSSFYGYDEDHRMTSDTDRSGLTFHFVYGPGGRCVESWGDYRGRPDPSLQGELARTLHDGVTRAKGIHHCRFEYHDDGSSDVIDSVRVRRFFGNAFGLLDKIVSGAGVTTCTYRDDGHLTSLTDPMGGTTTYERDERGRATRIIDPLGGVTELVRDDRGDVVSVVDPAGATRTFTRDAKGNIRSITDALGGVTTFDVDERGLVTGMVTPRGDKSRWTYDAQGNCTEIVTPGGAAWRYRFDHLGRRVEEVTPTGAVSRLVFSDRGDLTAVHDAAGGTFRFSYDGERHVTSLLSQGGRETRLVWGGYHRLCERTDANGAVVRMRYDLEGRMLEVHNERGEVHHLEYDPSGLLVAERTFDGRAISYKYDLASRLERVSHTPGEDVFLTRDAAGRVVARELPDGNVQTFEYDQCGRLLHMSGDGVDVTFERDAEGRLVGERQSFGDFAAEVRSTLDPMGNRVERRTSLGHREEIVRDGFGDRRRTVLDGGHVIEHARDAVGREIARQLQGGARLETAYDGLGRITRRRVVTPVAHAPGTDEPAWVGAERGVLADKAYGYDADSNIVDRWEGGRGTTAYRYDPVGQLLAVVPEKAREVVFRYDAAGNMHEDGASAPARRYGEGSRLERRGDRTYRWNDAGQLVAAGAPDATGEPREHRYEWNASGLLSRVHTPEGDVVEMTYDPMARRIEKRVLRGRDVVRTTRFVWDKDNLVHEITRQAAAKGDPVIEERTYCFHDQSFEPLAHRVRFGWDDPGRWLHYENDPAGTPERLVDERGKTASTLRHAPWGAAEIEGQDWAKTPLRFQGQYEDDETGLRYNRHRYYDPVTSRFVSADPIGLRGGIHAFNYAPNPLGWIDPHGLGRKNWPDAVHGRPTLAQQAVIDRAKAAEQAATREAKANNGTCTPVSAATADALVADANAQGVPVRMKETDINGEHGFGPVNPAPHIHVNGAHVFVPPGYRPPAGSTVITSQGPTVL